MKLVEELIQSLLEYNCKVNNGVMLLKVKAWDVLIIGGLIIGTIGCFMPWFEDIYRWCGMCPPFRIGFSFIPGSFTFYVLLSVAVFQLVFMLKRKVYMIFAVLASGLMALLISGNWILNPVEKLGYFGTVTYTPLYGAYVTLLGALIISTMAFVYIAATAEKQLSLSKSTQRT